MRLRLLLLGGLLLGLVSLAAAVTYQYQAVITVTALSTELTTLTDTSFSAASAVVTNTTGVAGGGQGAQFCEVQAALTFAGNPTAGSTVQLWFLGTLDGTTFEDVADGFGRTPNLDLPVTSGQTTTVVHRQVACPLTDFKARLKNASTGQTISSGTIKIKFFKMQGA